MVDDPSQHAAVPGAEPLSLCELAHVIYAPAAIAQERFAVLRRAHGFCPGTAAAWSVDRRWKEFPQYMLSRQRADSLTKIDTPSIQHGAVAAVLWIGSYLFLNSSVDLFGDYRIHADYAATQSSFLTSHGLVGGLTALLLALFNGLTPVDSLRWVVAGFLVMQIFASAALVREYAPQSFGAAGGAALTFAIVALALGPASIFTYPDMFATYIKFNVVHNPTVIAGRALAILQVLAIDRYLLRSTSGGWIALPLLTVLSSWAKPNFNLCLVPALAILLLPSLKSAEGRQSLLRPILLFFVPAFGALSLQYLVVYGQATAPSSVIWAPFAVALSSGQHPWRDLALSCLFPALALALHPCWLRNSAAIRLAVAVFLSSCFYTYFLAESGPRFTHGNFWWGSQISLLILTLITLAHFSAIYLSPPRVAARKHNSWRFYLLLGAIGLHLVSGVVFQILIQTRSLYA